MTAPHDVDRQLQAFLLDGPTELPDPSFDAVRDRLEGTRQRVVIGPWRMPALNKLVPLGAGVAAVAVALVIGSQLLSPSATPGVGAAPPSATPAPTPPPTPSPTAEPSGSPDASLPEGPLLWIPRDLPQDPLAITVDIPAAGWATMQEPGALIKGTDLENLPESAMLAGSLPGGIYVYGDPCDWKSTMPETPATTVDDIVAALAAQASRDASDPVDVTIGGYTGKKITLHVPEDAVFEECDDGEFASFGTGNTRDDLWRWQQGPGQIDELWFLDVNGVIVVIDAMYRQDTSTASIEEMRAIAHSATFDN